MTRCQHCGARVYTRPGHSGRYALTDRADGTDVLGSGSECPSNERGHKAAQICRWCGLADGEHDGATHDAYAASDPSGIGYNRSR